MKKQDSTAGAERRRHARFSCEGYGEVVAFHPKLLFRGEVRDISLTGCYIATRARIDLQRYAEIELRFCLQGRHYRSLGRVVVVRPGQGAGIEFLPDDPRIDTSFRDVIEALSKEPDPGVT